MMHHPCEDDLRTLIARKLHADMSQIGLDAPLIDTLGIDSLTGLELMAWAEEHFDVYFSDDHIAQPRTLANILAALDDLEVRKAS